MKGSLVDEEGNAPYPPMTRATPASEGGKAVVAGVLDFARLFVQSHPHPVAIGLAVPGVVDEYAGFAIQAVNLGWENVPLQRLVEEMSRLPTIIGHDVRLAGFGEHLFGSARGYRDFLLVTIGTGVGAAMFINGKPYAGSTFRGGEFGHMVADSRGPLCACGKNGCIEAVASARAIERNYMALTGSKELCLATEVPARMLNGDVSAQTVWNRALDALALGISNYVTLLDPAAVILGGGLAKAGEHLLGPLRERVTSGLASYQNVPRIDLGALGGEAGWRGAAARAWQALSQ
jgi:glucokinase